MQERRIVRRRIENLLEDESGKHLVDAARIYTMRPHQLNDEGENMQIFGSIDRRTFLKMGGAILCAAVAVPTVLSQVARGQGPMVPVSENDPVAKALGYHQDA